MLLIIDNMNWVSTFRTAVQKSIDEVKPRCMHLADCKDFIIKLIQSKASNILIVPTSSSSSSSLLSGTVTNNNKEPETMVKVF